MFRLRGIVHVAGIVSVASGLVKVLRLRLVVTHGVATRATATARRLVEPLLRLLVGEGVLRRLAVLLWFLCGLVDVFLSAVLPQRLVIAIPLGATATATTMRAILVNLVIVVLLATTKPIVGKGYLYPLCPLDKKALLALLVRKPISRDNT